MPSLNKTQQHHLKRLCRHLKLSDKEMAVMRRLARKGYRYTDPCHRALNAVYLGLLTRKEMDEDDATFALARAVDATAPHPNPSRGLGEVHVPTPYELLHGHPYEECFDTSVGFWEPDD